MKHAISLVTVFIVVTGFVFSCCCYFTAQANYEESLLRQIAIAQSQYDDARMYNSGYKRQYESMSLALKQRDKIIAMQKQLILDNLKYSTKQ